MRLLIITDAWFPQVNGVVRTYEHLSEELRKLGHTVKVIGPADFPLRVPMPGYAEIQLAIAPYRALSKMIEDYAPDKIHLSTEGPLGWAGRRYCRKHNRAFSTSYHTQFPDYVAKRVAKYLPFLYRPAHNAGIAYVRRFHAPSKA
ncbi:MAG: glycosyltransferase, partial [Bdellovibrionales bacterium]